MLILIKATREPQVAASHLRQTTTDGMSFSLFVYQQLSPSSDQCGARLWIVCGELTRTAGVGVEVLQEGQEGVRGDAVDGNHSAPSLCVLSTEHGRHHVTAGHQHRPVGGQYTSCITHTKTNVQQIQ